MSESTELIDIIIYTFLFIGVYFQVFIYVTLLERRLLIKDERARGEKNLLRTTWPTVTIVVPAYNEEKTITGTIESLLSLDYPKEKLTIMVINDGSTDGTLQVAQKICQNHSNVTVLNKKNGGKHTALNLAIEKTTSEFIGCLDADSFVDKDALKYIVPYFDNELIMAVTPSVQIWKPKNIIQHIQAAEYTMGTLTRKIFSFLNALYVTPGPFSIYRRTVFERIGGFTHGFNTEDMEMALRMQFNHMIIANAQDARVYTVCPETVYTLYKQRVRWVSGFLKNVIITYRKMIGNTSFGYIGAFSLPFAVAAAAATIFFVGYGVKTFIVYATDRYVEIQNAGIHFGFPSFDWFFFNLEIERIIAYFMLTSIVVYLLLANHFIERRFSFTRGMFYFLFFYGLIAPLWLLKSFYNLLRAKEAPWR